MLANKDLYSCLPDGDKATILADLKKHNFDQLPLKDSSDNIIGYVTKAVIIENLNNDKTLSELSELIGADRLVTNGTSVIDAFGEVSRSRFLYVLKGNRISGLVTYSDFDKRPVRILLYSLIGELEHNLIEIIKNQKKEDNYWLDKLSDGAKKM